MGLAAGVAVVLAGGTVGQHYYFAARPDTVQVTSSQYQTSTVGSAWSWAPFRRHRKGAAIASATQSPTATATASPTASTTTGPTAGSGAGAGSAAGSGAAPAAAKSGAGVPSGLALKPVGEQIITKAGTVIDGADISGGVDVRAQNVVIKNSRVSGQGDYGIYVRSGSLTVQNTTVTGFDNSVAGDNYTASGVEVTRANEDGFKIGSNVTIEDSWCHDLVVSNGAHSDCGQVQSGVSNVMIRGNWFDVGSGDGNSALFLAPDLGPSSPGPLVIENNVLGGGNFTLQCVDGGNGKYFIKDITISGNQFLDNSRYGPLRVNVDAKMSGNIMRATKQAVSA